MYLIMELNKMPQSISFTLVLKKRLSINYRNMLKYESVKFEGQNNEIPEKIAEYAENFDIVIMGHLKFDKIYRFVHQSTAADLINLVSIPIMVIPEDGKCEFILEENVDQN